MAKQFFSNNYDINYNDYLKHKKGKAGIKKLISDKKYYVNSFIDYDTFLTLTKAFYKQINNKYDVSPPRSISDADSSYKSYKSFKSHVDNCSYCCSCKNISHVFYCKEIQNILYPYGESVVKRDNLDGMYYPRKLRLNEYCSKKCEKKCSCGYEKKCSCGCEKPEQSCGNPFAKTNIFNMGSYNSYDCNSSGSCCGSGCNSGCNSTCPTIKGTTFPIMTPSCPHPQNCGSYCGVNTCADNSCKKYKIDGCGCGCKGESEQNKCKYTGGCAKCVCRNDTAFDFKKGKPLYFKEKSSCGCQRKSKCKKCYIWS